jgi:hypothetical protein
MPHFNRVSVQEIGQRNSLCVFVLILASPWSVRAYRRVRQNTDRTITISSVLTSIPVDEMFAESVAYQSGTAVADVRR